MNAVKLDDIAKKLNLSPSTVSRALTGNGRVGKKTRERVIEAAKESGYRVNAVARSLRLKDMRTIGVIVPDITNTFFSSAIKGVQSVCRKYDYTLVLYNSDEDPEMEAKALRSMLEKQVSGLIIASVSKNSQEIEQYGFPVVYIDNLPQNAEKHNCVSIDNHKAACRLTELLIEKKYKKIGFVSGPKVQTTGELRFDGFVQTMRRFGIAVEDRWCEEGDFRMESGYELTERIMDRGYVPEAIVYGNNYLAYGGIRAIRERKKRIPEDIAVVSFDANDETGLITPLITSINQPAQEIGVRAAEIILTNAAEDDPDPVNIVLEPILSVGESC